MSDIKDPCDVINQIYYDTCVTKIQYPWNMTESVRIGMEFGKRYLCLDAIKLKLSACPITQTTASHSKASPQ
jgi:hypothetical protein